jgi:AraC-like DNA-binding protein
MIKNFITPATVMNDLVIVDIGEENFASMSYHKPNQRNHFIIHFVVEGKGIFRSTNPTATVKNELTKGTAFAIYPSNTVFYQSVSDEPLYYFWVGFDGTESEHLLEYMGFSANNPTLRIKNGDTIVEAFRALIYSWKASQDKYMLYAEFYRLLNKIRINSQAQDTQLLHNSENEIFKKTETYLRQHIYKNVKVQELVSALNIDRSYFSKIFKKHYHTTPHQYILHLRLKAAEMLLITTNYSIANIVDKLSFTDTYSFAKQFKKTYGLSPTSYRKRHQENKL